MESVITRLMKWQAQYLTTIQGIGPILAATLLAEIGDIQCFPLLESMVAYAGINPSIFESGEFSGRRQHTSNAVLPTSGVLSGWHLTIHDNGLRP